MNNVEIIPIDYKEGMISYCLFIWPCFWDEPVNMAYVSTVVRESLLDCNHLLKAGKLCVDNKEEP